MTVTARTHLHATQEAAGARFESRWGWEIPTRYGDPLAEHGAVRGHAGVIDVSYRGKIRVTGADRTTLLHGITSNDVKALQPGQGHLSTSINDVGRIMLTMNLACETDSFMLDVDPHLREKTMQWLDRYIITEDVTLEDETERFAILGVHGPDAARIVQAVLGTDVLPDAPYQHAAVGDVRVAAVEYAGVPGFDLWCAPERATELWAAIVREGARPFGLDALNTLRIEAGIPWYGMDMDEENNPLEAGLNQALNYDKGCYMGQEVMARLTFRAGPVRVQRGLRTLDASRLTAGDRLVAGEKEVGWITSAVDSPTLGYPITLGYVRREHKNPGTVLVARHDDRNVDVEVVELPWVKKP